MSTDTNFIGNVSTMVKLISMWLAGWFIGILISHGLNLPMSQEQLSQIICSIILLAVGYVDAKYPNTFKFLGNSVEPDENVECDDNEGC